MSRPEDTARRILDGLARLASLRREQQATGDPVMTCGQCRGNTRFFGDERLVQCETCGAYLLHDVVGVGRIQRILCVGPVQLAVDKRKAGR